jgi:hypothetical protein
LTPELIGQTQKQQEIYWSNVMAAEEEVTQTMMDKLDQGQTL